MNELNASLATVLDAVPVDDAATAVAFTATCEFVGSSDDNIAEAVRRALAQAALSLRTLDGVGVVVIPQIDRHGSPRFHVTLRVSPTVLPASHP